MSASKTRKLIRKLVKEMAFKRVVEPIKSQADDNLSALGPEIGDPNVNVETYKGQLEKYFKSPLFAKQANKFYGDRNFPGSNTWVAPFLGSEYAAYGHIILGNETYPSFKNSSQKVPGIEGIGGGQGDRMITYPITPEIVERLGLKIGGNDGVNLTNDIIFVPIATAVNRNFLPSVHMIVHAMFDQLGVEDGMPLMNDVMSELEELAFNYYYIGKSNPVPSIHPGTTNSLRNSPFGPSDFVAEVLSGAILYRGGINKLPFNNDLKQRINDAVEEFRNHIKGKVVMVTVA
jgi:hypothetical protein